MILAPHAIMPARLAHTLPLIAWHLFEQFGSNQMAGQAGTMLLNYAIGVPQQQGPSSRKQLGAFGALPRLAWFTEPAAAGSAQQRCWMWADPTEALMWKRRKKF